MIPVLRAAIESFLRPSYARFSKQLEDPWLAQRTLLDELISNLAATEYGRSLGVRATDSYENFAHKLPIVGYDDVGNWIERQKSREGNVMVSERVLFYEKTSGSSGPARYIPYTRGLKASFNKMFSIWLCDLLRYGPRLETGRTFISISPAFAHTQTTQRGIKIGLEDDSDYLSPWMRRLLKRFLVVPPSIKRLQDPSDFKHALSALLIAEPGLEVISIWNPSLIETLLDWTEANRGAVAATLRAGVFSKEDNQIRLRRPSAERLALLEAQPMDWARMWPKLKLISCWAGAHSAQAARRVGDLFPQALVQGKGLIATEAPLTLPLIEASGFVPLPGEVFYEFLDERGNISLLHELEPQRRYEIVLTQKGGLYRYRLGDAVRVSHFYKAAPCLEFVGRTDAVCDMVGEKLNEEFVRECLSRLTLDSSRFQTLLPVMLDGGRSHYTLLADALDGSEASVEDEVDRLLCGAYHYRNARLLGQLAPVKIRAAPEAREMYYEYFMRKGMKWGDIKHQYLVRNLDDAANLLALLDGVNR